ncbi:XrtA/PEP-CTERM system TPR-repeat protein PrsT [Catenovulum agarivorans]|uniref:XrtA/PEP-CTERM system TPR-repeat protein PrsT n=1 Tax=Catenovulum agarivorans TaxID=1172192 RepID=UPI0002F11582|nr:XrtA/PEP-CTERM system TPR-repeat protein PrsT [Catenovulum agarivorans]
MKALIYLCLCIIGTAAPNQLYAESQRNQYYEVALADYRQGSLAAAVINLKNSLQQSPSYTPARILLGQIYVEQEDYISANKELTIALTDNGDWRKILPLLVQSKIQLSEIDQAIELVESYPFERDADIVIYRARLAMLKESYTTAEDAVAQVLQNIPTHTQAQLLQAELLLKQNALDLAIKQIEQILSTSPDNIKALLLLAQSKQQQEDLPQALAAYDRILSLQPEHTLALFGKTSLLQKLQRGEESLALSLRLRDKLPNNPFAKLLHAVVAGSNQTDEREVKEILNDINAQLSVIDQEKVPSSQIKLMSGYVNYLSKNYQSAKRDFLNYKLNNPDDSVIYKMLAETEIKLNNLSQALFYYQEYLQRHPENELALAKMLSLAKTQWPLEEYAKQLAKARTQFPENVSFRNHQAAVFIAQGHKEKAHALLKTATQSNIFQLDLQLSQLLVEIEEYTLAGEIISALLTQQPLNPLSHQTAAELYIKVGQTERAQQFLQQALQIRADYAPALLLLASLAVKQNELSLAHSYLQKIDHKNTTWYQLSASLAMQQNDYAKALNYLQASQKIETELSTTKAIIELHLRMQQYNDAYQLLSQALEQSNLDAELLHLHIKYQLLIHQAVSAKTFNTLFGLYYDDANKLFELYSLAARAGNNEIQQKLIRRIAQLDHDPARLLYVRVQQAINQADVKAAHQLIQQLKLADQQANYAMAIEELEYNLAYQTQNWPLAQNIISNLFTKTRSAQHFKAYIGVVLQQQQFILAEQLLDDWLSVHPSDVTAINLQSQVLQQLNKTDKLLDLLTLANNKMENAVILHKLAHLLTNTSFSQALQYAKRAVELAPTNPAYTDTYGWLLFQDKQYDKALEYLRISESSDAKNPYVLYHLSATLVALKRTNEALEILQNLIKQPLPEEIKLKVANLYKSL